MVANPSMDQSLVGAILSRRFRLMQELGRGGMGAVYAAEMVDTGQLVAVKIIHPHFIGDIQVLQRFLEEGRTCMRLDHPNILRVHECNTAEDGSSYLVMDLLEGVPLSAYTRNGGRVSVAHAVPILLGMLAGLEHAHKKGVVHRDLKPGNVFLAREPEGLFSVKLLDFGIAKVMDVAGGMGNKTKTGMLLGTPAYMSPEQIKSAKDVDGRADLWSAGVMFYEMLTGRTAFPAPTEYARLSAVLQTEPEAIASIDPQLAALAPFIARALQKDPGARYQDAREMAVAVRALSGGAPGERRSAPGDPASRVVVAPLSRLPERPWVDAAAPASDSPNSTPSMPFPAAMAGAPGAPGAPALESQRQPAPVDEQAVTHFEPPQSSTLASLGLSTGTTPVPSGHAARIALVEVVAAPSAAAQVSPPPAAKVRRGVHGFVVFLLVVFALAAGFVAGYVVARM
jgi:eukaryotic-like serine/threonine-protein kinase